MKSFKSFLLENSNSHTVVAAYEKGSMGNMSYKKHVFHHNSTYPHRSQNDPEGHGDQEWHRRELVKSDEHKALKAQGWRLKSSLGGRSSHEHVFHHEIDKDIKRSEEANNLIKNKYK